jgi:hypothetical protein
LTDKVYSFLMCNPLLLLSRYYAILDFSFSSS